MFTTNVQSFSIKFQTEQSQAPGSMHGISHETQDSVKERLHGGALFKLAPAPTFWQTMMKVAVCLDVTRPSPPQNAMSTEYSSHRGVHLRMLHEDSIRF